MSATISLRPVEDADLPIFFAQQLDPEANRMAAFTPRNPADRADFDAHWRRIRADPSIILRTIVSAQGDAEQVAGYLARFVLEGQLEVGYWLGREFWGRGVATAALRLFLAELPERPLRARVAHDNVASLRVLQKCGFVVTGADRYFANARGQEIDEWILTLEAAGPA